MPFLLDIPYEKVVFAIMLQELSNSPAGKLMNKRCFLGFRLVKNLP